MRFIVCDCTKTDMFTQEFDSKESAIKCADKEFERLTKSDLAYRTEFYVLESVNPDEDAPDHFDGEVIKKYM